MEGLINKESKVSNQESFSNQIETEVIQAKKRQGSSRTYEKNQSLKPIPN